MADNPGSPLRFHCKFPDCTEKYATKWRLEDHQRWAGHKSKHIQAYLEDKKKYGPYPKEGDWSDLPDDYVSLSSLSSLNTNNDNVQVDEPLVSINSNKNTQNKNECPAPTNPGVADELNGDAEMVEDYDRLIPACTLNKPVEEMMFPLGPPLQIFNDNDGDNETGMDMGTTPFKDKDMPIMDFNENRLMPSLEDDIDLLSTNGVLQGPMWSVGLEGALEQETSVNSDISSHNSSESIRLVMENSEDSSSLESSNNTLKSNNSELNIPDLEPEYPIRNTKSQKQQKLKRNKPAREFACDTPGCRRTFSRSEERRNHYYESHRKALTCPEVGCNAPVTANNLVAHLREVHKRKNVERACECCGEALSINNVLKHKKTCSGIKKDNC